MSDFPHNLIAGTICNFIALAILMIAHPKQSPVSLYLAMCLIVVGGRLALT